MVRKIYLEDICDRESLRLFLDRFHRLTGLNVIPFNERGESVFGNLGGIFATVEEASEFVCFPGKSEVEREDGSCIRIMRLQRHGHLYGTTIIGPYIKKSSSNKVDITDLPVMSDGQIDAAIESIDSFFLQMVDLATEKEALARKEKILSVLEEASNIMNSNLDFQNLMEFLLDIAIDITGATCGALLLRKEGKEYLEVSVARGKYPQEVKKIRVPFGQGITGWVASNKEALNVPNVLLEPRYIETPEAIYSELAIPLVVDETLIGVIAVDSSEINAFSKDDTVTLNTLASMVTKVLENLHLLSDSKQKLKELSHLFSISEKLSERALDNDEYDLVLKEICEAISCNAASLMLFNSDSEELRIKNFYGLPKELATLRIRKGKGYHGWVAAQQKALLIDDVLRDNTITKFSFLDKFSKTLMIIPLSSEDRLVGTLGVYYQYDSVYISDSNKNLLNTMGRIITSHFENERLFNDSKRKLDYLSTLYKVGSSVSTTLNLSKLFDTILQQVQEVMDVENCSMMPYDPIENILSLDAAIGLPSNVVGNIKVKIGEGIAGWVAQNKQPVLLKDISRDSRFSSHQNRIDYTTRSVLSVPVLHHNELLGVLNVNNKRSGDAFVEDDLNLLLGISGQISQAIANANLHEMTDMQVAELSLIQELGKAINSSLDLDSVLTYFIDMTTRITESDRATLMLYDDVSDELYVEVSRGFGEIEVGELRLKVGEGIAGKAAKTRRPVRIENTGKSRDYKKLPVVGKRNDLTLISAPLVTKDNLVGVINCERIITKKGPFHAENLDLLETLASQASIAIENARLYHNLLNVYLETIRSLAAAIDAKDSYTHGHSKRVTDLSVGIALEMKLPKTEVDTIRHASLLHDVGKIGISEQILLKPGRLTDEEFDTIKSHPHIGAGILNSIEFLKNVCEVIEHHHERFDGKGYPDSLAGKDIPLGARIICVADSFDAITSCRPYRKPLTFDEATEEIVRCSGAQFDPRVVEAFVSLRTSTNCPPWFVGETLDQTLAEQSSLQL